MKNVFFVGINGIGMSGLAKIMKELNYNVYGSDPNSSYLTEEMRSQGITIYSEHKEENIKGMDTLVVSTAISKENPEYKKAMEEGIPVIKRGELLAKLLNQKVGLAVAGTHGKTTTSSMLATVLLEKDPTIVVGGIVECIKSNAKYGAGEYFVAEADESDNSFLYMRPKYSVITNIEADHLEKHGSLENIKKSFNIFMQQTEKEVIVCLDNKNIQELIGYKENVVTYSLLDKRADIYADGIKIVNGKTIYDVYIKGEYVGEFSLSIPGKHNVYNSLPVIYLAREFGLDMKTVKEKIENFKGAKRRYDVLFDDGEIKVIDDYAHHPTEIEATLQGAKSIEDKQITVIFQPHRYSRVKFLLEEFAGTFKSADELILMPVYSAGEKDEFGVTLEDLLKKINHENGKMLSSKEELEEILNKNEKRVYMFMGAGSISSFAHEFVERLENQKKGMN